MLSFALSHFAKKGFVDLTLTGNADVQRRYLPQFCVGITDHVLEGLTGRDEALMFIKKRNAEYRVIEQRPPSFFARPQLHLDGSSGVIATLGLWCIAVLSRSHLAAARFGRSAASPRASFHSFTQGSVDRTVSN